MAEPNNERSSLNGQMKGSRKRAGRPSDSTTAGLGSGTNSTNVVPCGACKYLRRRCVNGCIFAPHFGLEQGAALFAAVHKIFGASNVSKLLVQLPPHHRHPAVQTISYEAQARLADPVCGCVSVVLDLYQQVVSLQTELAMAKNCLISAGLMVANTPQSPLQQPEKLNNLESPPGHRLNLQPAYSYGSSASNNMINMNMFDSNLLNLANDHQYALYTQPISDPLLFTGPTFKNEDDYLEETEDALVFADQMF